MIIDGKKLAKDLLSTYSERVVAYAEHAVKPGLAILFVGADPSSKVYVNMIRRRCEKIDLHTELFEFDQTTDTDSVVDAINALNNDSNFSGIIVQFPLPRTIDATRVREAIAPLKDVDSAGTRNIGRFYTGAVSHQPCTPQSMLALLKTVEQDLAGKRAVVIGRSHVVGKPIANMLLSENMTVSICHSKTSDLAAYTKTADVIMAATGIKHLVDASMIKPGAIVVDAGIIVEGDRIYGDVNPEGMEGVAKAITPVPGGVGPVTIVKLIGNVLNACERLNQA